MNKQNISDKDEFLLILKEPTYGKIKEACLEHLSRYPNSIHDIEIYESSRNVTGEIVEYAVDIYAQDEDALSELHDEFRQSIYNHVGQTLVHTQTKAKLDKEDDNLWILRYYILGKDPNLPWFSK